MDRKFSIGFCVGTLVSGLASIMINVSQQVGMGLLIITGIWAFLFVFPKSPVRNRWWSVSDKLGIIPLDAVDVEKDFITINIGFRVLDEIQINKISLKTGRKSLPSVWEPKLIQADHQEMVHFSRPKWLGVGEYKAYLKVETPNGYSKSKQMNVVIEH
ncbi:hypothetical protein ACFLWF_00030 [Chloroflexota bacterium]